MSIINLFIRTDRLILFFDSAFLLLFRKMSYYQVRNGNNKSYKASKEEQMKAMNFSGKKPYITKSLSKCEMFVCRIEQVWKKKLSDYPKKQKLCQSVFSLELTFYYWLSFEIVIFRMSAKSNDIFLWQPLFWELNNQLNHIGSL